jgi:hypothetical protein
MSLVSCSVLHSDNALSQDPELHHANPALLGARTRGQGRFMSSRGDENGPGRRPLKDKNRQCFVSQLSFFQSKQYERLPVPGQAVGNAQSAATFGLDECT